MSYGGVAPSAEEESDDDADLQVQRAREREHVSESPMAVDDATFGANGSNGDTPDENEDKEYCDTPDENEDEDEEGRGVGVDDKEEEDVEPQFGADESEGRGESDDNGDFAAKNDDEGDVSDKALRFAFHLELPEMCQITRNVLALHHKATGRRKATRDEKKKAQQAFAATPDLEPGKRNTRGSAYSTLEKLVASRAYVCAAEDATSGSDQLAASFTAKMNDAYVFIMCRVAASVGVGPGTCSGEDQSRCNVRVSSASSQERLVYQKAMSIRKVAREFNNDRISSAGNVASGERTEEDVEAAALKKFKNRSKSLNPTARIHRYLLAGTHVDQVWRRHFDTATTSFKAGRRKGGQGTARRGSKAAKEAGRIELDQGLLHDSGDGGCQDSDDDDVGGNGDDDMSSIAAALSEGNAVVKKGFAALHAPPAQAAALGCSLAPDGPTLAFLQVAVTSGALDVTSTQFTNLTAALMAAETQKAHAAAAAAAATATAGLAGPHAN